LYDNWLDDAFRCCICGLSWKNGMVRKGDYYCNDCIPEEKDDEALSKGRIS
jgi:hypothetical protein